MQVWYDDPQSLALKYQIAVEHHLQGIGFWNLDCLDYDSKDPQVQQQTAAMWAAVRTAVAAFKESHGTKVAPEPQNRELSTECLGHRIPKNTSDLIKHFG